MGYVSYLRVSTDRQGLTGYGMDAQRSAISGHLRGEVAIAEYVEVESGKNDSRPELLKAIAHCKRTKATLVIAKLDRLSRKVSFVANLLDSGVEFIACDNPHANRLTIHILAAIAEHEREMISKRTKEALAAAKSRGVVLGGSRGASMDNARKRAVELKKESAKSFAASVYLNVKDALGIGGNLTSAASILNERKVLTSAGCLWSAKTVSRVMQVMG